MLLGMVVAGNGATANVENLVVIADIKPTETARHHSGFPSILHNIVMF